MTYKIQVTLTSEDGYKPMSTIVEVTAENYLLAREKAKAQGILKICAQRSMSSHDLKRYGYNKVKMRIAPES